MNNCLKTVSNIKFKLLSFGFKIPLRKEQICETPVFFQKFNNIKFLAAIKFAKLFQQHCSNQNSNNEGDKRKPALLMQFDPISTPKILLSLKNWILSKFIIQPYLDRDFTLKNFTYGAKQALGVVSSYLSQGDFQSLQGLISEDAITEIKNNFPALNVKERQDLFIKISDILFTFPHQVGIIFDDDNQKRFAEITVVYHCMDNFGELKEQGVVLDASDKDKIKICNYRFIREYTKGVESDWIINRLGHFKLCHFEN